MACDRKNCCWTTNRGEEKVVMHVTCARQAGFEVVVDQVRLNHSRGPLCYGTFCCIRVLINKFCQLTYCLPSVRCYRHGGNDFNLRARLEDLLEIEKRRAGQDYSKADLTTNFADAARFLYSAISVLRTLGWAWRWAEFWVDYDSSWEPLIEIGQNEKKMSDVELKKVHSTRESRYQDARACRLAAFGAALRNRAYDIPEGFNNEALNRALTTIINTPSLVGPLSQYEKDFFVDWLGRAYRTKSRLLYFGENKNIVSSESEFCTYKNGSLKYELGERMLPGAEEIHIADVHKFETDDFLTNALLPNSTQKTPKSASFPSSKKSKLIPVLCPGEPKKIEKSSRRNRKNQLSETCATGDDTTDSGSQSRNRDRPIALRCSPKPTSKFREELNAKSPPVSVKKSPPASVEKSPPTSLERTPPASLEPTPPASLDPKPPASLEPTSPASVKPTAPYTGKRRGRPPRRRIMTEDLRQVKSVANAPPNAGGGVETIHEVPAGSKTKSEESGNTSNGDDGYVDANKIDHIRDVASALSATSDDFPSEGNDNDIPNNINDGVSDCPTRDIQVEDTTQFLSTDPTIKTMAQRHKSSEEIGGGNYRGLSSPFVENTINVKSENCGSALDVLPVDLNIEPLSQCPIGPPQLLPDSAGIDECSREETRPADVDDVIYSDKKSKRESRDRMVGNVETNQQTQAFDIDTAGKTSFKRKFKQIDETKDSTTQILTSDATSGVQAKNMSFTQEGTPAEEPDDDDIPIAVLVFEMKAKAEKGKKGDDNGGRNRSKREKIAGLDERPHTKDAPVIATRSKETPQQRGRRRGKRLAVVSGSSSIF